MEIKELRKIMLTNISSKKLKSTVHEIATAIFKQFQELDASVVYRILSPQWSQHPDSTNVWYTESSIYFQGHLSKRLKPNTQKDVNFIIDHCVNSVHIASGYSHLIYKTFYNDNGFVAAQLRLSGKEPSINIILGHEFPVQNPDMIFDFRKISSQNSRKDNSVDYNPDDEWWELTY